MNDQDKPEAQLLDDYFDDRGDAESLEQLDQHLASSDDARRRFWQRAGMEEALAAWGRKGRDEATAMVEAPDSPARTSRWPVLSGWVAAAIMLGLVLFYSDLNVPADSQDKAVMNEVAPTPRPALPPQEVDAGNPVAYLSELAGLRADFRYFKGQTIRAGHELIIDEGLMELVFFSGARVTIEGPARLVPNSDFKITVLQGSALADVPESAIGFKMVLPDGVVTDYGTTFGVKVAGEKTLRVQVIEGEIELASQDVSKMARRLFKGQAVMMSESGDIESIDYVPMEFNETLERVATLESKTRMKRWRAYCRQIDQDLSVVAHFSMLPEEAGSDVILNQSKFSKSPRIGAVISAEWTEGRWPGKPALSFRRPADRVRVDVPGEFPQATFLAWARIDGFPRHYNGLFLSESGIEGEAHWQFSSSGQYYFGVRPSGSSGAMARFHRAWSEPVISSWLFGSWRMLATTYDADRREVIHYVDGAEVARTVIEESVPLRFGRATLGNFFDPKPEVHGVQSGIGEEWSFRNWTGAIDEFILFSRVLNSDELAEIHEVGRVD